MKCTVCGTKDRIKFNDRQDICDDCLLAGAGMNMDEIGE
jgi:phage/plasmid primase-like uncharacterized protein